MGAKKGNQNAKGNKGGGRKSSYQEMAEAQRLHKNFFEPKNLKKLQKQIEDGTYSGEDMFVLKLLQGNTRLLEATISKIWGDKVDLNDSAKKSLADFLIGEFGK